MQFSIRAFVALAATYVVFAASALAQTVPPAPEDKAGNAVEDRFQVPDGTDTQVLLKYLKKLNEAEVEEETLEGIKAYLVKYDDVVSEIMSRDVEPEVISECVLTRQAIFNTFERFGAGDLSAPRKSSMLDRLRQDERPVIQKLLAKIELAGRIQTLTRSTEPERQQLIQDVAANFQDVPEGDDEALQESLSIMLATVQLLDRLEDKSDAIAALQLFSKNVEVRKDERLEGLVEHWRSVVQRYNLPGNPIEIKGLDLTGKEFDIDQWKGKVVLIDYWGTFCPACIAELPHLTRMYEAYHDKGFEVVGIALDEERFAVESFVKRNKTPWPILFEDNPELAGMGNPNATRYGIELLPTVILVDQSGKVVSLDARGPELVEQLEKLLGPIPAPAEPKKPAASGE